MHQPDKLPITHVIMAEHVDKQAQENGIAEDDVVDRSKPLRGMVLCCTSISADQRTSLAKKAEDMGAQHVFDLTSQVTHLIAGEYNTPKYRFVAKERPDVKMITSDFIEAVRLLWLDDRPVPIKALEKQYLRPTFQGLRVCVTGFDDPSERQSIASLVRENGAEYSGDLTKSITHLITFRTSGAKYQHALNWGLHVVALEWLHESLERGTILDETLYNPQFPKDRRGIGAWKRERLQRSPLGKRAREASSIAADEGKRKLRRTASTKLRSQSESLWGDIAAGSPVIQAARSGVWDQNEPGPRTNASQSLAFDRNPTIPPPPYTMHTPQVEAGVFHRIHFLTHGFQPQKISVLQRHISSHDGTLSIGIDDTTLPSKPDDHREIYVLVPHDLLLSDIPMHNLKQPPMGVVTEFWIERCINHKSLSDPSLHVLSRPMRQSNIPGFSDLIICSTGFNSLDLLHMRKIIPILGATYDEFLSYKTSILLFNPEVMPIRQEKHMSAMAWNVKIVNIKWLWDCIEEGDIKATDDYLLRSKKSPAVENSRRKSTQNLHSRSGITATSVHTESGLRNKKDNSVRTLERSHSTPAIRSKLAGSIFQQTMPISRAETVAPSLDLRNQESNPPLAEISTNSSIKTVPTKEPQMPREETMNVINTIMSKRPSSANSSDNAEKKRIGRILGRAASNISTSSRGRESSVDSTASHGNPVQWPQHSLSNSNVFDSDVPQQTQMQWVEDEGAEIKERVVARMMGEKVEKKGAIRERAVTLGDINAAPRRGGRRNVGR